MSGPAEESCGAGPGVPEVGRRVGECEYLGRREGKRRTSTFGRPFVSSTSEFYGGHWYKRSFRRFLGFVSTLDDFYRKTHPHFPLRLRSSAFSTLTRRLALELVSASPGEIDPREEVSLLATASLTTGAHRGGVKFFYSTTFTNFPFTSLPSIPDSTSSRAKSGSYRAGPSPPVSAPKIYRSRSGH